MTLPFGRCIRALVLAGAIGATACAPSVGPHAVPPVKAPSAGRPEKVSAEDSFLAASLEEDGFRPLPTSCAAVAKPVATAEQAVCIALGRVYAELRRSDLRYVYKGQKVGGTWELSIWPVAMVSGGGCEVTISAESGAITEVFWDR